jgi:hypothetical protein
LWILIGQRSEAGGGGGGGMIPRLSCLLCWMFCSADGDGIGDSSKAPEKKKESIT